MNSAENRIDPEIEPVFGEAPPSEAAPDAAPAAVPVALVADARELRGLEWVFIGGQGLRAGWSVLIAVILYRLFTPVLGTIAVGFFPALASSDFSPAAALFQELVPLLSMVAAGILLARIEHRKILDYNLNGPRRPLRFVAGLAGGFAALSVLVGALAWGGWLHFGPVALSGAGIFESGALWAAAFLLVGFSEEGSFRCFLQFTLTRGINFWWALGVIGVVCLDLLLRSTGHAGIVAFLWLSPLPMVRGDGAWGVYAVALLGLVPCLLLHMKKAPGAAFWQAAWVTSTLFGLIHLGNGGENFIGIFAAAAIGFVFCVSVRLTGSAWWAIGCHSAWDWAETYFYGTADSGLPAKDHYLTAIPAGNPLMSGGTDGPEGSLLVLGIILLLLVALLAIYGRGKSAALDPPITQSHAG
ncbi:MAG: CPBP family glutamic-type intramembrane protease [Terracidiphilus sp.]